MASQIQTSGRIETGVEGNHNPATRPAIRRAPAGHLQQQLANGLRLQGGLRCIHIGAAGAENRQGTSAGAETMNHKTGGDRKEEYE